ncbi:MAG: hypothetical protein KIS81_07800 [Maricaulaceae bacterium]|nr:hypothetical protein [Maricaulaceae bacterium]
MQRLYRALLIVLFTPTAIPVFLPFSRGWMDGASYEWGMPLLGFSIGGAGIGGDYLILSGLAVFLALLFWAAWRAPRRAFGALAAVWFAVWAATILLFRLQTGPFMFRGDTLGVAVDITIVASALAGAGLLLALALLIRPGTPKRRAVWAPFNTAALTVWLAGYGAAFFLLRDGEPHGTTDQYGVVMLLTLILTSHLALAPWGRRGA